ncbi:hypothetical protein GOP47_0000809 [Adiantum capillus-veneris]|uniref:Pentatricopeptide repeat-containing protein n=1 Tax=Adiantum capillus-veneris TaxID=13818 RepID=A0A9D4ZTE7_ADICA|nr:hypothetical protein GOP47_0000809 [Adiantum capillus-veneris]
MPLTLRALSRHNPVKTTLRILSCAIRSGQLSKALAIAERMQALGICITRNQAYFWLQECSKQRDQDLEYAKRLQSVLVFSRLDSVQVLADHLIRYFASCGSLTNAEITFEKVAKPSAYTWSAIISAHSQLGKAERALHLFHKMMVCGSEANECVFLGVLKACSTLSCLRLVHHHILQSGLQAVTVGNSLVDLYSRLSSLSEACTVFDKLPKRNVVSCNSMIAAYIYHKSFFKALGCFGKMQAQGIDPDDVTFSSTLMACSSLGVIKRGRLIHHQIIERGLQSLAYVGTALADMYGKCGSLADLLDVFKNLPYRDVVSWGALIAGCAECGDSALARNYFLQMQKEGFKPNEVTFTSIFAACSNAGLIDEGCMYLKLMTSDFGLKPNPHHCFCVIDLLARAGKLVEAERMLQDLDSSAAVAWRSLLSASKTYGNVELGRRCFDHLYQLDPDSASGYILMSKIYLAAGMREEALKIEKLRPKWKPKVKELDKILNKLRKGLGGHEHKCEAGEAFC